MELLERENSLSALRDCRPGSLIVVSGEAGIGKTSLLQAFRAEDDRPFTFSSCDALRTPRPLGPLRDISRQVGGSLARIMAADAPRHDMFSAFLDHLSSRERVIVVEDVHWADEATLDLLIFAGRRVSTTRSLLIVSYRDEEVDSRHPLRRLLGALANDPAVRRIRLSPLSETAVATLAAPFGVDPSELHTRTGGNPFFVTEALADPDPRVPDTVRDAVLARVAVLDAQIRDCLQSVAIFPGSALRSMIQAPPEVIDAGVDTGILALDAMRVRFRHEIARLAVEESIPASTKARLHARALADLERRGAEPAHLAYHAEEAGDVAAVLIHAPHAAEKAAELSAYWQAADHYARALRYADGLAVPHRAELLELYAENCQRLEWDDLALDASQQALDCWRAVGDQEREAAILARRSHYLWQRRGDCAAVRESVQEALGLAAQLPPGRGLVATHTWAAVIFMLCRDVAAAIETGGKAILLAERLDEQALLARALNAVGTAQWFNDPDNAEKILLRSLEVARQTRDDSMIGAALINLGSGAGEIRRYTTAEYWLREAVTWCSAHDMDSNRRYATAWLARCLFERGDWQGAAETLDMERDQPTGPSCSRMVWLTVLGRLQTRRGDPEAKDTLDEAWAMANELGEEVGDIQNMWPVAAGKAELAWLTDSPAESLVQDTYDFAVRVGHTWAIGELGRWLENTIGPLPESAALPYRLDPAASAHAWDQLGCPYEAAVALTAHREHLREALTRFERLSATPAANRAAKMMRDHGIRGPRRSTLAHPDGLTAREVDVLELLREGLRNIDIAERLHISEKTVDHHVSAILTKLGVRNRKEAALR